MGPNFNNGSIQATGINGSGNYSIEVVNSINGTTQNPFALIAGNYNLIVNDETSNCQDIVSFIIENDSILKTLVTLLQRVYL